MAAGAARRALDRAGICSKELQFIDYAGVTRDHCIEPSTAHNVQRKLGAAFLLGRKQHPDHGFLGFEFASDGSHADLYWCGDEDSIGAVYTDMPALLREATALGASVYNSLIDSLNWSSSELRWYIPHQIGKISFRIHNRVTGVPASKMPNSYEYFGNLITGNIPVCVDSIRAANGLATGDKIWMAGAGSGVCAGHAGLVWG